MTVEFTITGRRRLPGQAEDDVRTAASRPARIACLLALAHRFEGMVRSGAVEDYAELARLGHVTRARVTQLMNLLNLAPEIQEYLLWLPSGCRRLVTERDLRRIAGEVRWDRQRALFHHHAWGASASRAKALCLAGADSRRPDVEKPPREPRPP